MFIKKALSSLVAVAAFLSFGIGPAHALPTSLNWQFAGWYGGGAYPAVVPDAKVNGRFYLLSDVAGLWRSDDRGGKWNFMTKGVENLHTAVLAIAPSNNSVLYTGTKGGVHKSTDAGATWSLLPGTKGVVTFFRPDNFRSIVVHKTDSNRVYAGTKPGYVYQTTNGGSTWTKLGGYPFGSATPVSALYLTNDGTTLFASSPLGVAKWNGTSWTRLSQFTGVKVYDMMGVTYGAAETIYATSGNKIAYSSNKGSSWAYTSAIPTGTSFRLSVKTDASGTRILAGQQVGWSGDCYLSTNKGASWQNVDRGIVHDALGNPSRVWTKGFQKPLSVTIDPNNSNVLYWSDWWGVFRSDDGGLTWVERIKGAPNTVGTDVVVSPTGSILVGSMDNGLMKSNDQGVSYTALAPKSGMSSSAYTGHFWRVVAPTSTKVVATSSPWDTNVNQVAVSNDGGATFSFYKTGLPAARPVKNTVWDKGYARSIAVDPTNSSKIYIGIDGDDGGGLYVSTNGGTSWAKTSGQPASKRIYNGLSVDPTNAQRIYWATVGAGGGIYRSQDGANTWTKVFGGSSYVFDIEAAKDGTVYAAADTGGPVMYVSRDKGTTWSQLYKFPGTGTAEGIAVDPNNSKRVAVSTVKWDDYAGSKVYVTENGGTSWVDVSSNLPNSNGSNEMVFSKDGQYLYVARYAGSVYRLYVGAGTPPSPAPEPTPDPTPDPGDTTAPSTPTGITGAAKPEHVVIWWNAATDNKGVTGYRVYRNGVQIGTSSITKFYDANVGTGVHRYQVRAYDAAGNLSALTGYTSINVTVAIGSGSTPPPAPEPAPSDTTAPTAPKGLTNAVSGTKVTLWWTASTDNVGVTGYRVYRNGTQIAATSTPKYYDYPPAGAWLSYTVKAVDAAGNLSAASNVSGARVA